MRTYAFILALMLVAPQAVQADDADLPPPQVIRRSGAQPVQQPPAPVAPTPLPTLPMPTPPMPTPPMPAPPRPPAAFDGTLPPPLPPAPPTAYTTHGTPTPALPDELPEPRAVIGSQALGGAAGYDQGFLIRGSGYSLRVNAVLQARWEGFEWNDRDPTPGGDRSGFSLPRAVLRLSGDAPCSMRYLIELDFGSEGGPLAFQQVGGPPAHLGPRGQTRDYDVLREAWIEYAPSQALRIRAGLVRTPATRQLMTRPEKQQFVDIALASSWVGLGMPGYTDRNRDFGLMLHGAVGSDEQIGYMVTVTNGDGGDAVRNVLDGRSSDNLAFAGRLNWAFLEPVTYQEGALRQCSNRWYGELGAWAFYYADRIDTPPAADGDYLRLGVDLALGFGPWSFTGAFTWLEDRDVGGASDDTSTAWLVQLGHHFTGGAWEIAARWSGYDSEGDLTGDGKVQEYAFGVNYYLNGHGNKLQLDAAYIESSGTGALVLDPYPAYPGFLANGEAGWLVRLQWQLAL